MTGLLVICNDAAGSNDRSRVEDAVGVLERWYDVETAHTANLDELTGVLARRGGRSVVVVGGDGSLHTVVRILHRLGDLQETVLGLIPQGTGNDFARTLRLPLEPKAAAEVIVTGRQCNVDLLVDDRDGVVVNAVHAGVGADAGTAARPWKWLGPVGSTVGAFLAGVTTRGNKIRVTADGKLLADGNRRLLQVGVGNGAYIGGGVQLTPEADPTDGLADVLVSFAVRPVDRLVYALRLRRGTQKRLHDVMATRAHSVTLSSREGFCCNADGEVTGPIRSRTWTVRQAALTVCCSPASAPELAQG